MLLFILLAALDASAAPRLKPLAVPGQGKAGFTLLGPEVTGITFTNRLAEERAVTNQIFLNGSGVAAGDVDGDGHCDLYFCGLDSPNALYRNLGHGRFVEITENAGVACADQASTGTALADMDGDGDFDLLVNGVGRGTRLFLNDGQARFTEVTRAAGLGGNRGALSLALADVDGDGFLDLYVVNYRVDTMRDMPDIRFRVQVTNGVYQLLSVNGLPATSPDFAGRFTFDRNGGVLENGQADTLYRNNGRGSFRAVSWTNGAFLDETGAPASMPYDWGLAAMFRDLNGDHAPDLYVCNDFQSPDRIWLNDGRGGFRALARGALRQTSLFSMGVDVADLDRDGDDDIFVADMLSPSHARRQVQLLDAMVFAQYRQATDDRPQSPRNTLLLNRGNGTYAELARLAGLEASDWSWCPAFMDVDLDGYEDLLVTTGHWRDAQNADVSGEIEDAKKQRVLSSRDQLRLRLRYPRLDTPNVAWRNRHDLTFEDQGRAWGFDSRRISHGIALADLDNDGDLDLAINCLNDAPLVYRNDSAAPRLAVRLRGRGGNRHGIGARVEVMTSGLPRQTQEIICGGRYLSSDAPLRVYAAGHPTNRLTIQVTWRSGHITWLSHVPANHAVEIDEIEAGAPGANAPAPAAPAPAHFQDATSLLSHRHVDEIFDDFARQPLLPHKLSEAGPGITWFDFNHDGWDDLIIGTGRGGRLGVFRNDTKGGFVPQRAQVLEGPADRDVTSVLGWRSSAAESALLIGSANYERPLTNAAAFRQLSLRTGVFEDGALNGADSFGALTVGDFDGDADLDLFVAGRVVPGRYPEAASSFLLRNHQGKLQVDAEASRVFSGVGLVSAALFSDLNADGWPELVLACDWGGVRVYRNQRGTFEPWPVPLRSHPEAAPRYGVSSLDQLTGWWNSVATGDFDQDGRPDLVAGNWGRNTAHQRFLAEPIRILYPTVAGNLPLLEAHHDPVLAKLVPARDLGILRASFSVLHARFPSFTSFRTAGVPELVAAGLPAMRERSAVTLDSVLFLNRGDHFVVSPLPVAAQMSPIFGLATGDLDGDGATDVFFVQNFFGVSAAESRHDAGCGGWLRGDGQGTLIAVETMASGIFVDGEGRGAALADFDHDGRLDLAVGQNRGPTKLYRNHGARPGLRVRLEASGANPEGIGGAARVQFRSGRFGPLQEVQSGAGYWSQGTHELLFGIPEPPQALEIRWPGGASERLPISEGNGGFIRHAQRPRAP